VRYRFVIDIENLSKSLWTRQGKRKNNCLLKLDV
jgi:hypothetical protein